MAKLDVELPASLNEWVESRVDTGVYADAADYIRDLVRRDHARFFDNDIWNAEVSRLIAEGEADIAAGRVHDIEDVFAEVEAAIREVEGTRKAAE